MANTTIPNSRRRWILLVAAIASIVFLLTNWLSTSGSLIVSNIPATSVSTCMSTATSHITETAQYVKPQNTTIIGLLFFGRKSTVEILSCYLEVHIVQPVPWMFAYLGMAIEKPGCQWWMARRDPLGSKHGQRRRPCVPG